MLTSACDKPHSPCQDVATTYQGNFVATSQDELDELSCVETVAGDVIIERAFIDSLRALASLKRVQGDFRLASAGPTDLAGLENLERVDGTLTVSVKDLGSLAGLKSLRHAGGLAIGSTNITSLRGLEALEQVERDLTIYSNDQLVAFDHLHQLRMVGGTLQVSSNKSLVKFEAPARGPSIGSMIIANNAALTGLGDLRSLRVGGGTSRGCGLEGGAIGIMENESLTIINGLGSARHVGCIAVTGNPKLEQIANLGSGHDVGLLTLSDLPKLNELRINLSVARELTISRTGLRNLSAFAQTPLACAVSIWGNLKLLTLGDFGAGRTDIAASLRIFDNPNLPMCEAEALADALPPSDREGCPVDPSLPDAKERVVIITGNDETPLCE